MLNFASFQRHVKYVKDIPTVVISLFMSLVPTSTCNLIVGFWDKKSWLKVWIALYQITTTFHNKTTLLLSIKIYCVSPEQRMYALWTNNFNKVSRLSSKSPQNWLCLNMNAVWSTLPAWKRMSFSFSGMLRILSRKRFGCTHAIMTFVAKEFVKRMSPTKISLTKSFRR